MKLYTYFRSSAAFRARIALNLKGVRYEPAFVDLRVRANEQIRAQWLALNPQGLVPALIAQDTPIAQSLAIIEYLDEAYPDPPLLPRAPLDRARVRAMALAVACDIHPLNNLRVLNHLRSPLGHDDEAVSEWARHWISEGFRGLEQEAIRSTGDGRHMFGSSVTMADVCIVPQMFNARRVNCDLEPFPTLRGICQHLEGLSSFAQAAPDNQPDAS